MPDTPNPLWYKDAVIYQAHVRAFFDSSNDGVGDFAGLTQKLEYIESVGVNAVWLLPFYPSPLRDDGYDIADYETIHPSYGTLADFDRFVEEAHRRHLRVITELVINHTSDQHPWFQAARRAPAGSVERDFYVWSDTTEKYQGVRIIFTDTEKSNWEWDDTAKAYYWHRFFHHQPDLNFDNPAVLDAVIKVMRFWLDRGVDGLRLDAVPYLIEREGTICENLEETHAVLKRIRHALDASHPDRMLLAEANQWPADVRPYFGDGDECHMAFHFPLMPRMFMAVRQEDRHPIVEILRQTPEIPENCQWAMFLRNHDELTLEMVTDEERDYMYQAYAADPQMRINVGIRRRLAPLLENSRRRIELLNSLLFSMPGTPVIYYGDEIGMGDNIYLGDRNGVRTPMQWTGDRNGGFSLADPARLYAPPIMDPVYGYQAINVESQGRSAYSILNWMRRMLGLRKDFTVFGRGTIEFLPAHNRKVLIYVRQLGEERVLCVANVSRSVQPVEIDLSRFAGMIPLEMLGLTEFPRIGELPYFLTLGPFAFYWFRLQLAPTAVSRVAPATPVEVPQAPGLLVGAAWETLLEGNVRTLVERERLLPFLQRQRWFGGKARPARNARFIDWGVLRRGPQPMFLTIVEVEYEDGGRGQYFLPLTICTSAASDGLEERAPHAILATVTGARKGVLFDASLDDGFAVALLEAIGRQDQTKTRRGAIRASHTQAYAELRGHGRPPPGEPAGNRAEQHVDHLRRPADPEAVPADRARHQPRLRDWPAAHGEDAVQRGCRPLPGLWSTSWAPRWAPWAWCSSSSKARLMAGRTQPTRSGATTIRRAARLRRSCPHHATSRRSPPRRSRRRWRRRWAGTWSCLPSSVAGPPRCTWRSPPTRATRPSHRSRSRERTSRRSAQRLCPSPRAPSRRSTRSPTSPAITGPTLSRPRSTPRRTSPSRRTGCPARARRSSTGSDPRPSSTSSAPKYGCTGTITSARCSGPKKISTCSTSRGSPRVRWRSAARSRPLSRTSRACCARSVTPPMPASSRAQRRGRRSSAGSSRGRTSGRRGRPPPSSAATSKPPGARRFFQPIPRNATGCCVSSCLTRLSTSSTTS